MAATRPYSSSADDRRLVRGDDLVVVLGGDPDESGVQDVHEQEEEDEDTGDSMSHPGPHSFPAAVQRSSRHGKPSGSGDGGHAAPAREPVSVWPGRVRSTGPGHRSDELPVRSHGVLRCDQTRNQTTTDGLFEWPVSVTGRASPRVADRVACRVLKCRRARRRAGAECACAFHPAPVCVSRSHWAGCRARAHAHPAGAVLPRSSCRRSSGGCPSARRPGRRAAVRVRPRRRRGPAAGAGRCCCRRTLRR